MIPSLMTQARQFPERRIVIRIKINELLEAMLAAEKPLYLDLVSAFEKAREVVQESAK